MARPKKLTASTPMTNAVESIGKLQLKVLTDAKTAMEQLMLLPSVADNVKARVEEIKGTYAYNLQEFEIEMAEKRATLEQALSQRAQQIEVETKQLEQVLQERATQHARQLEQLQYQHATKIRDAEMLTATQIAAKLGKVVIDATEWNTKKEVVRLNEEDLKTIKTLAISETDQKVRALKDAEILKLTHTYDMQLAMAKKDIESLAREVDALRSERVKLQDTIERQNANIVKVAEAATRPTTTIEQVKK